MDLENSPHIVLSKIIEILRHRVPQINIRYFSNVRKDINSSSKTQFLDDVLILYLGPCKIIIKWVASNYKILLPHNSKSQTYQINF